MMIKLIYGCILSLILVPELLSAQNNPVDSNMDKNFPLIFTLHFQNLAMPFRDTKSNFGQIGISVGTEIGYNSNRTWLQQMHAGFYFNRKAGNGLFIYTQSVYRPSINDRFYGEVKAGIGWQYVFHPVQGYKFQNEKWIPSGKGKLQWIVPIGFSIGYNADNAETHISSFVGYQIIPALFYNKGIPLNFYTSFQTGMSFKPKY